jgi:hypothetical protein
LPFPFVAIRLQPGAPAFSKVYDCGCPILSSIEGGVFRPCICLCRSSLPTSFPPSFRTAPRREIPLRFSGDGVPHPQLHRGWGSSSTHLRSSFVFTLRWFFPHSPPAVIPNRSPVRNPSSLSVCGVPHPQVHRGWGFSATHLPLSFVLAGQLPAVIPNCSPARNPSSLSVCGVPHPQLHRGWGF